MSVPISSQATRYRGRFAPSPTGPLHLGSLLTATASYLDAKQHDGSWLVRMEDLDPPREQTGAASAILTSLEAHGLLWDATVVWQSQRLPDYHALIDQLLQRGLAYPCTCSRQMIKADGDIYSGHCRLLPADITIAHSIRLLTNNLPVAEVQPPVPIIYADIFQGLQSQNVAVDVGDFVIRRRDGLIAYQLAVVADDIAQDITHVVRGCDLLDNTPRQLWLYSLLKASPPEFGHVPILTNALGQKLSKQTFAPALNNLNASANLTQVLTWLNHAPPIELRKAPATEILAWACTHWSRAQLPSTPTIVIANN